jgi:hypothetical protein
MLERAMSARQMIEEIKEQVDDLDAPVVLVSNYGDHHGTMQALPLMSVSLVDSVKFCESGYSQSGVAICDGEDGEEIERDEEDDDDPTEVVVLNLEG